MSKDYKKYFEETLPALNNGAKGKYTIVDCEEDTFITWSDNDSANAVILFGVSEVKNAKETIKSIIVELDIDLDSTFIYLTKEHGPEM